MPGEATTSTTVTGETTTTVPEVTTTVPRTRRELPRTGAGGAGLLLQIGAGLLAMGTPLALAKRRSRRHLRRTGEPQPLEGLDL